MSVWERQYRDAVAEITSPEILDDKILHQAREFKPIRPENRWLSKAASSCAAVAVVVLLIHPAQYLGALTPNTHPTTAAQGSPLSNWQQQRRDINAGADPWFDLRSQVNAGNYLALCQQWRRQQRGSIDEKLPRDLAAKAREHCRLLPTK